MIKGENQKTSGATGDNLNYNLEKTYQKAPCISQFHSIEVSCASSNVIGPS